MDIRIYDSSLTLRAVCDRALRAEVTESFRAPGTCTLTVPLRAADLFHREGIITIPGIGGGYVLDYIHKDGGKGTAEIRGRGVLSLFARRVLPGRLKITGAVENTILALARAHGTAVLGAPLSTVEYGLPETAELYVGDVTLLSAMQSAASAAGLGLRLAVTAGGFLLSVRAPVPGEIRLSRDGGQITGGVWLTDGRAYANQVIVIGGDGRQVTVSAQGLFDDGVDDGAEPLRQVLLDVPEITPDLFETEEAYLQALREAGIRHLGGRRPCRTASVEIAPDTAKKLVLGGVYETEDPLFGISGTARCREKTMIFTENGIRWKAVLEDEVPDKTIL